MSQLQDSVMKWSSRPQDDRRRRVRDNQRRHRERTRSHVTHLETRLAETEIQLREALLTIKHLTSELDRYRKPASTDRPDETTVRNVSLPLKPPSPEAQCRPKVHILLEPEPPNDVVDGLGYESNSGGGDEDTARSIVSERPVSIAEPSATPRATEKDCSHRDLASSTKSPLLGAAYSREVGTGCGCDVVADEEACRDMDPPQAGESTTRCRDAYRLIMDRNYSGWDHDALRRWLGPGFRGPVSAGDGCRVENMLLFALLDRITS